MCARLYMSHVYYQILSKKKVYYQIIIASDKIGLIVHKMTLGWTKKEIERNHKFKYLLKY